MHRFPALLLGLAVGALLLGGVGDTFAQHSDRFIDGIGIKRPLGASAPGQSAGYGSIGHADTIWVGYDASSTDPNKVGSGAPAVWDFDTGVAGTDSTQFWRFFLNDWRSESTTALPFPTDRPAWYYDHGNEVNIGDTNLWLDRDGNQDSAIRSYRKQGIIGYWHVDDMNVSTAFDPDGVIGQGAINGTSSAWCGLRGPGDTTESDEVTGNYLNGDLARYWAFGGQAINGSWPGYGNQIDQILYHDFTMSGGGGETVTFKFRTDLAEDPATENNGSAWYTPDPTFLIDPSENLVLTGASPGGPVDSLMVWVGRPNDTAYDVNKRWLSEVLDFGNGAQAPYKPFSQHGKAPLAGGDSTVTINLTDWGNVVVRIAFQVKTNRQFSDETYDDQGFDSAEGAALIDDVAVPNQSTWTFDTDNQIRPRATLNGDGTTTEINPATAFITTGKPPAGYGHIESVFALDYDDPCGALTGPDAVNRLCDLNNNVITLSNHDDPDHAFFRESWVTSESPTINVAPGTGLQNELTAHGMDLLRLEYQMWTGTMDLDQSVFWNNGARYIGPGFPQQADQIVPAWSDNIVAAFIAFNPDASCTIFNTDVCLDGIIPPPSQLDSLMVFNWTQTRCARFGATVLCGKPEGGYFDNMRVGFTGGEGAAITAQFWDLLADTFPFNEDNAPGTAAFDTSTSLIKCGLNNAASSGGEGVMIGDSLSVTSAFISGAGQNTRLDLLFRIQPGPGSYSTAGDMTSALVDKGAGDGTPDFYGTYLAANGPFGSAGGHGGTWNPNVWNSARMDSADNGNISPLAGRRLGIPVENAFHGTLHESDANYATLGITHNLCFLVDPSGPVNNTNVCCSAAECGGTPHFESWPPGAYSGAPTTTIEGTKILPDGWFTPGTHIEYFMRRSDDPAGATGISVTPDTNLALTQTALGPHSDGQRFLEIGVFPDLWKDSQYGGDAGDPEQSGLGLACLLVVDAGDRRGQEHQVLGALDTLGYGKASGAGRGWLEVDPANPDPNNPAGFVPANLGQKGLSYDWFDIQASESAEGDRPGCRLASPIPSDLADRQCKQGPTPDMLKHYYNTILWMADDLESGVMHDGFDSQEQSNDVDLIQDFLATSGPGNERAVWVAGDGAANDMTNSMGNSLTLLSNFFAVTMDAEDYRTASGVVVTPANYATLATTGDAFHAGRNYGYNNSCVLFPDVISVNGGVVGGEQATRYEDFSDRGNGGAGPFGATVYRPADNTARYYTTIFSGHQVPNLRGDGLAESQTDAGRIGFVDDAMQATGLVIALGPVIAIGDIPGASGAQLNFVGRAYPNPAVGAANLNFTLAQPAKVTIRFYNVAGRLINEVNLDGVAGANNFRWDGRTVAGTRAAAGVYFYRLSAPGIEFRNNNQRMVFLGQN